MGRRTDMLDIATEIEMRDLDDHNSDDGNDR